MANLKTYWTVKTAVIGGDPKDLFYKNYDAAKQESKKDYRDKPIKHTVKADKYDALDNIGAFED